MPQGVTDPTREPWPTPRNRSIAQHRSPASLSIQRPGQRSTGRRGALRRWRFRNSGLPPGVAVICLHELNGEDAVHRGTVAGAPPLSHSVVVQRPVAPIQPGPCPSDKRSAQGSGGLEGDGAPAVPQGPSATARAWNGHPGFRSREKASEGLEVRPDQTTEAATAERPVQTCTGLAMPRTARDRLQSGLVESAIGQRSGSTWGPVRPATRPWMPRREICSATSARTLSSTTLCLSAATPRCSS